jgi:uncharacterized phiE125 gp8 family phage protein
MWLEVGTAPAATLISTAEAKSHLRISHTDEDTYLGALVAAVDNALDGPSGYLRRAIVEQEWVLKLGEFPAYRLVVPLPPLISLDSVTYYDLDNASQTLSSSVYTLIKPVGGAAYLELNATQMWPSTYQRPDAITVAFTAGYATVPPAVKQAALLLLGEMYAARGDDTGGSIQPVQSNFGGMTTAAQAAARALLGPYLWREAVP